MFYYSTDHLVDIIGALGLMGLVHLIGGPVEPSFWMALFYSLPCYWTLMYSFPAFFYIFGLPICMELYWSS